MTNAKIKKLVQDPLILPIYLPTLLMAISYGMLTPIHPLFAASFDVSYGVIGLVVGAQSLGMLLGDLPAGMIQQRIGQKKSLASGILLMMISTGVLFWANSIILVLALRFMTGFGHAMTAISRHSYIAEVTSSGQRGRSVALFGGVARMGMFIGPIVGGSLATAQSLRTPFLVYGLFFFAALILFVAFTPTSQAPDPDRNTLNKYSLSLSNTARSNRKNLFTAGAGQMLFQLIRMAPRQIILPLVAADSLGLDVQSIGIILSITSAVDMTLFYPAGLIMDRFGRKYAIITSILGLILGTALIPMANGYNGLMLVGLLIGFANGLGSGTMMTLGADLAPPNVRAEFISLWRVVGDIGATSAPLIVGWVADTFLLSTAPGVIAGIGLVGALVFAFGVPETLRAEDL